MLIARAAVAWGLIVLAPTTVDSQAGVSKWWHQTAVQRELCLTPAQVGLLDEAFQRKLPQRISLRRTLDDLDARLHRMIDDGNTDEETVMRLSARVEQIRADRNVARTLMLFEMYRVLTPSQRVRLPEIQKRHTRSSAH
jgi:Spy/CpxP family protein refolding chaperone